MNSKSPLISLLALIMAESVLYQNYHWMVSGEQYYSDHELYERLYFDAIDMMDGLAEKIIGNGYTIDPCCTMQLISKFVGGFASTSNNPDDYALSSLSITKFVLSMVDKIKNDMELNNDLTIGIDDMLASIAGKHEEFTYLLRQRNNTASYMID